MGLFQPIDESIHDVINYNSTFKHQAFHTKPEGVGIYKAMNADLKSNKPGITGITRNRLKKAKNLISNGSHNFLKPEKNYLSGYASTSKHYANESSEYFDESIHDIVNLNSFTKHTERPKNGPLPPVGTGVYKGIVDGAKAGNKFSILAKNAISRDLKSGMDRRNMFSRTLNGFDKSDLDRLSKYASTSKHYANEATEGISLSTKKLVSAGGHNSSDLNAVKPNAEYCDQYDKHFIGDGEDPETSKVNVPAVLAARTAGGDPFDQTLNNGINKASADVFHLKKFRDDEGMNG